METENVKQEQETGNREQKVRNREWEQEVGTGNSKQ